MPGKASVNVSPSQHANAGWSSTTSPRFMLPQSPNVSACRHMLSTADPSNAACVVVVRNVKRSPLNGVLTCRRHAEQRAELSRACSQRIGDADKKARLAGLLHGGEESSRTRRKRAKRGTPLVVSPL